jgi:hypothetical protein
MIVVEEDSWPHGKSRYVHVYDIYNLVDRNLITMTLYQSVIKAYIASSHAARRAIAGATAARVRKEEVLLKHHMLMQKMQREYDHQRAAHLLPYAILVQRAYRQHLKKLQFLNVGVSRKVTMKNIVNQVGEEFIIRVRDCISPLSPVGCIATAR